MLALAWMSVNAIACAVPRVMGPAREPRPWLTPLGVPDRAPSAHERLSPEPVRVWTADAGRGASGPPAVGDSVIGVLSTDGRLTVLQRATGRRIWDAGLDGPGIGSPLLDQQRIYAAAADGRISAFDLPTGRRTWSRLVGPVAGAITAGGGRLYAAGTRGMVVALAVRDGSVVWRRELEQPARSEPATVGDAVVVATDDSLFRLAAASGAVERRVALRGLALNPPAVRGDLLIYTSPDGFVAGVVVETLEVAWRVETGEPILGAPAVTRDTAYALSLAGTLWEIPLATPGKPRRTELQVAVRAPPAPLADGVLVATVGGEVLWVVPPATEPRWKARVDGPVEQPPIVDRGLLVFVDGRGKVQAWK